MKAYLAPYIDSQTVNRFNGALRQKEVIMASVKSKNRKGKGKGKVKARRHNSGIGVVIDLCARIGMEILLKGKVSKVRMEVVALSAYESDKKRGDGGSLKLTAPSEHTYDFGVRNLDALKEALGIVQYDD